MERVSGLLMKEEKFIIMGGQFGTNPSIGKKSLKF